MSTFEIPDQRSTNPEDYLDQSRFRRMKQSWDIGVSKQNQETLIFDDGFTWGSIGQIMGYLLGEVDDSLKEQLWEKMFTVYKSTDRGSRIP